MRHAGIILYAFITLCLLLPLKALSDSVEKYQFYARSLFPKLPYMLNQANSLASGLGEGWSSDNDAPVGQCLFGKIGYVGTPSASLSLNLLYNYKDVLEQLNLLANGNFTLAGFQLRAAANYSHMLEDSAYTQTFIYRAIIRLKNRRFVPPVDKSPLTWIGRQYAQDPMMFRANCGDKFISEQQLGGMLYVAVKLKFHTRQEKLKFNASLGADINSLLKLTENLSKAANSVQRDGALSVTAFQMGGDPTKLGKILGAKSGADSVSMLSCSLDNLRDCHKAINAILVYASDSSQGNFPAQFKTDDSHSLIGPGVLKNILQSTTTVAPVKLGQSLVTQAINDARAKISHDYQCALRQNIYIRGLLTQRIPLSADYVQQLDGLKINVENNVNVLRRAGQACYANNLSECLPQKNIAEHSLVPVDVSAFEKRILALGVHENFLFPYADKQYIFGSLSAYEPTEIFSIKTLTKFKLDLENPSEYFIARSFDGGLTYRGYYYNKLTRYLERMIFIPDFGNRKQCL